MGNPDLSPDDQRGLVIFPAASARAPRRNEWWLVLVALALAGVMIAIAFAIR
jgi:MYXO-CTERM domain-containing protein